MSNPESDREEFEKGDAQFTWWQSFLGYSLRVFAFSLALSILPFTMWVASAKGGADGANDILWFIPLAILFAVAESVYQYRTEGLADEY